MTPPRAQLFPGRPAVLAVDGAHLELVDFLERRTLRADGLLAREVGAVLDGAAPGPLFSAVGPLGQLALRLRDEPRVPLTPAAALRLQGFGLLFVELTLECTERCLHCYADAGPKRRERLDRETVLAALEDARSLGFTSVQLTGGDPLLCPFLGELLARARELGFEYREIFTNGLLLDDAMLAALAPHEPGFAFSLYSADPATHDRITQVAGSHRRTCDAISRVSRAGLAVRAATVTLAENAGHAAAATELARALGATVSAASASHAVGRGGHFEGPAEVEAEPESEAEAGAGAEADPWVEPRRQGTLCLAGDGSVYPCIFNRSDRLGRLGERHLRHFDDLPQPPVPAEAADPAAFLTEVRRRLQCTSCQCTAWALRRCGGKPWA